MTRITFQKGEKPDWLRVKYQSNDNTRKIESLIKQFGLHSVCQSAHCPNRSECWAAGTATFMIMGEICTRGCRFCAVKTSANPPPLDPGEPEKLAQAVSALKLKYIVITSVDRDDLEDGGASHYAECVRQVRKRNPDTIVETLIPDFKAQRPAIRKLVEAKPHVISHNLETVEGLTPEIRDMRAGYRQSLEVLGMVREMSEEKIITKSGIMVGFGEGREEVAAAMKDAKGVGVEIFTIGQYLAPSEIHYPVKEFVTPEQFADYEKQAYDLGFSFVASGPLVRSSFRAGEPFIKKIIRTRV
jgi:lipoic acid synthetase